MGQPSNNQNEPSHGVWVSTNNGQPVSNQGTDWNGHNNIQNVAEIKDYYGYDFGENTLSVDPSFKSAGSYQLSDNSPMIGAESASFMKMEKPLFYLLTLMVTEDLPHLDRTLILEHTRIV